MCAALQIYGSKLRALVQGFLSYFQQINGFFCKPLLSFHHHVTVTLSFSHAADELAHMWPQPVARIKEHQLCGHRDYKPLASIMILFFHLLLPDAHHHHANTSPSRCAAVAKSTKLRATHGSWITIYPCPCSQVHLSQFPHRSSSQLLAGLRPTGAVVRRCAERWSSSDCVSL